MSTLATIRMLLELAGLSGTFLASVLAAWHAWSNTRRIQEIHVMMVTKNDADALAALNNPRA